MTALTLYSSSSGFQTFDLVVADGACGRSSNLRIVSASKRWRRLSMKVLRPGKARQMSASPCCSWVFRTFPSIGRRRGLGRLEGEVVGVEAEAELGLARASEPGSPVTDRLTITSEDQARSSRPGRRSTRAPSPGRAGPRSPKAS